MGLVRVVWETPMALSQPGLLNLLEKKKIAMASGEYVVFVSKNETKAKILFDDKRLFYLRQDRKKITLEQILEIPKLFNGAWADNKIVNALNKVFLSANIKRQRKAA